MPLVMPMYFLRLHGVVIMEGGLFQNFRVQLGNAVDGIGKRARRGWPYAPDHRTGSPARRCAPTDRDRRSTGACRIRSVQPLKDLIDAGQSGLDHVLRPALQRLGHDGVVGVGEGMLAQPSDASCPCHVLLVDQQAHQLRNRHARMGVVDVDDHFFRQAWSNRFHSAFMIVIARHTAW